MKPTRLTVLVAVLAIATAWPAQAQTVTIVRPQVIIEEFYAFPHEGAANKLSSSYNYPETKSIDVLLRFEVTGIQGEQKASAFIAMASEGKTLAKQKEKLKVQNGRYEVVMPEVLLLSRVYGEHNIEMALELAVAGAPIVRAEAQFKIKGRDLPKVEVLDYWIAPGGASQFGGFEPGDAVTGELVFKLAGAESADMSIRAVGKMDEEYSLSIDPRESYQRYDSYWDETRGPRRDGTYLLSFYAYLPRYFYQASYSHHDFTIYVVFEAADQIVRLVGARGTIVDYRPGRHRYADDELMRVMQMSRSETWRLRAMRNFKPEDYGRRWFDET